MKNYLVFEHYQNKGIVQGDAIRFITKARNQPDGSPSTSVTHLDDDDLLVEHLLLLRAVVAVAVVVVHDECGGGDPPGHVAAQVAGALQRELGRWQLSEMRFQTRS